MYILKLKPVFKDYIWGGTKLRDEYDFESDLDKLAEGWMLSCHKDGQNTIETVILKVNHLQKLSTYILNF